MISASVTEVSLSNVLEFEQDEKSSTCRVNKARHSPCREHEGNQYTTVDAYDKVKPSKEPQFMEYVRKWEKRVGFRTPLRWIHLIFITMFHIIAVMWSIYYVYICQLPKWQTVIFAFIMGSVGGFGVTAGAHRYWCHRSYKAKLPLQLILMFCYSLAGQNSLPEWVRDHRVHHKHSETRADPHDSTRGFFFSHVGWLMMKKHPAVLEMGTKINMSDILNDPLVQFHTRYFTLFKLACCFLLPTLVPILFWAESWGHAILSQSMLRYMFNLHFTWAVNSFAHIWGYKPYDQRIMPTENWGVSVVAMGEGWHNYHHTFPWDYKAAELAYNINLTTLLLDMFAHIGWAYDLKQASPSLIKSVVNKRREGKYN